MRRRRRRPRSRSVSPAAARGWRAGEGAGVLPVRSSLGPAGGGWGCEGGLRGAGAGAVRSPGCWRRPWAGRRARAPRRIRGSPPRAPGLARLSLGGVWKGAVLQARMGSRQPGASSTYWGHACSVASEDAGKNNPSRRAASLPDTSQETVSCCWVISLRPLPCHPPG